ncbi:MAG: hypothetical protein JNL43_01975 [Flavobacteriales bacterium]|nr:hypothetical protein [Flavobacteriales bacterium]
MNGLRPLSFASIALLASASIANWTGMNVGATGCKSMTTFNGAIYVAAYNIGIQKSTTDGASWTAANVGLPLSGTGGTQIKVQSVGRSATAIFCGTESGVYRSTDNGGSWALANSGLPASSNTLYVNKFYAFGPLVFAVFNGMGTNTVWRSGDNGNSWGAGFSGLSANQTVYGMDEVDGVLYAATTTRLMRSFDLGGSWEEVSPGENMHGFYAIQGFAGRLVALTALGAKYSVNGGQTWMNSSNYPVTNPAAGSELISYDGKYYAITKSISVGCYRTLDGGMTWEAFNTGLSALNIFADSQQEFHASGDKLYIVCLQDCFSAPGSSVDVGDRAIQELPAPYPTVFQDHFTVDLSSMGSGRSIILMDAIGREVARHGNLPATPVRIERSALVAGRYHCMVLDPGTGQLRSLGSVIAQ